MFVDTSVLIFAGNDTAYCGTDSIQLNAALLSPAVPYCVAGYDLSSIPYAAIAPPGATLPRPVGDDVVSAPITIPFAFDFFAPS